MFLLFRVQGPQRPPYGQGRIQSDYTYAKADLLICCNTGFFCIAPHKKIPCNSKVLYRSVQQRYVTVKLGTVLSDWFQMELVMPSNMSYFASGILQQMNIYVNLNDIPQPLDQTFNGARPGSLVVCMSAW